MKKIIKKISSNETLIFMGGLFFSYICLIITVALEINLIWVSLVITILLSIYLTKAFFIKDSSIENLFLFLSSLFLIIVYFACVYMVIGLSGSEIIDNKPTFQQSIYFSIVTWTTLGYGDITPTTKSMPWAMMEVILGYIFMALLAGKVLALANHKKVH